MPNAIRRSLPLVAGLGVLAGTSYITLILAGRLLGAAEFAGISVLYVLVSSFATGLFLPVEQEIARRRGHERGSATFDPGLVPRAVLISMVGALALCLLALAARPVSLRLLGGSWELLGALCVALPGYALCFVSRGVFAGSRELGRYGLQLGVEGSYRLAGMLWLISMGEHSLTAVGWLFGAAPWVALAASLAGRTARRPGGKVSIVRGGPLLSALGLLLISSLAAQLLVNAGPVIIQLVSTPAERAQAGAFLAALVVVRVPVFLFTAVQPSFLPAMAAHSAVDQKADFISLTRRVLATCLLLTVVSTALAAAVGPALIRLLFGFRDGVDAIVFTAMGVSVGLFLVATILAQALLGRGMHAWTTAGWLIGLAAMAVGALLPGSAVDKATTGFLLGAVAAACTYAVLLGTALRRWASPATIAPVARPGPPYSANPAP
ncbi:MAG: lipopolysaccharide biosynthesis protein [Streptosporangiaceae bacterium]